MSIGASGSSQDSQTPIAETSGQSTQPTSDLSVSKSQSDEGGYRTRETNLSTDKFKLSLLSLFANKRVFLVLAGIFLLLLISTLAFSLTGRQPGSQRQVQQENIASPSPPSQNVQLGKISADLSYIWLYLYSSSADFLVDYDGQITGVDERGNEYNEILNAQYYAEGKISSPNDPSIGFAESGKITTVFSLSKPIGGTYKISISSSEEEVVDFELHVFDRASSSQKFMESGIVSTGKPLIFFLDYNQNDAQVSRVRR